MSLKNCVALKSVTGYYRTFITVCTKQSHFIFLVENGPSNRYQQLEGSEDHV